MKNDERRASIDTMKPRLVSCIVAVYNGERYLSDALESIFAQTYRPLEIIVVDDGSTDGTPDIIAQYGRRIRHLRQPNAGPPAARNAGLRLAKGEFVAFLDADDLWLRAKLARQVERFSQRPELGYCVTYAQNFWMPALWKERVRFRDHRLSSPIPGYVTQTLLARASCFQAVGRFDPSLKHSAKTEWFLRAAKLGVVGEILPDVLVYRRLHGANLSKHEAAESLDEYLHLMKSMLDQRRQDGERCLESDRKGAV